MTNGKHKQMQKLWELHFHRSLNVEQEGFESLTNPHHCRAVTSHCQSMFTSFQWLPKTSVVFSKTRCVSIFACVFLIAFCMQWMCCEGMNVPLCFLVFFKFVLVYLCVFLNWRISQLQYNIMMFYMFADLLLNWGFVWNILCYYIICYIYVYMFLSDGFKVRMYTILRHTDEK